MMPPDNTMAEATYFSDTNFTLDDVLPIYTAHDWSAATKPAKLLAALQNSHSVVYARVGQRMVGIGNAISDGHLVVYYPHLLVHPDFQRRGIGSAIMSRLSKSYQDFHQQMLTADADAMSFYEGGGFSRAGRTVPMWIYDGTEH